MDAPRLPGLPLLVAGLMLTQTMGWGMTFSQIGVLVGPFSEGLGLPRSTVFFGGTVMYLGAAVTAPFAGRMADRLGGLWLLAPGSVAIAAGLFLLSAAQGLVGYVLAWAIFGLVMHMGLVTAAYTGLAQVCGRDAPRAIGWLSVATALCSTIFWPVSEALLTLMDWRQVIRLYGLVTLAVCLPVHLALAFRFARAASGATEETARPIAAHLHPDAHRQGFWLSAGVSGIGALMGVGVGIMAIEIFMALGTDRTGAVFAGSLLGVAAVTARISATLLAERIAPVRLAQMVYGALTLSVAAMLLVALAGIALPVWGAALLAFGFGMPAALVGVLRSILPLHLFGSEGFGTLLGRQMRISELTSAAAPTALALLMSASLVGALTGLAGLGSVAVLGTLRLGRLRPCDAP